MHNWNIYCYASLDADCQLESLKSNAPCEIKFLCICRHYNPALSTNTSLRKYRNFERLHTNNLADSIREEEFSSTYLTWISKKKQIIKNIKKQRSELVAFIKYELNYCICPLFNEQ